MTSEAQIPEHDTLSDLIRFFHAWLSDPLRVATIIPTGVALANAMTREISIATGPVLELGAGTGVYTRALIARGIPEDQLMLVESGSDFAELLQLRFPRAHTLRIDATRIRDVALSGQEGAGAVVSGLPHATAKGHRHTGWSVQPPAAGRCVLSVHLWSAMPCATHRARSPWAKSGADRRHNGKSSARQRLPNPPAAAARFFGPYESDVISPSANAYEPSFASRIQSDETAGNAERARRLHPIASEHYIYVYGRALRAAGRIDEADRVLRECLLRVPREPGPLVPESAQ
ncbi:hypothetical protein EV130_12316 [Rhizobium azibense]|uniref:Phospholipid N-methyltransferase n=1 Tax=Rhizobium azibense TaxID=1136135 RepID=A0A4R3Q2T4_9HYPH|nr:hypothetical protein EV130_12316 [Rhizobium azibense]